MANYKNGNFTSDVSLAATEGSIINPVAEALALFSVKSGNVQHFTAHTEGNNYQANAKITLLYENLHLTPLKKDKKDSGVLKKKPLLSFIANTFIIKNNNPDKKGVVESPNVTIERDKSLSFYNFVWRALRLGILKTIGIPDTFIKQ